MAEPRCAVFVVCRECGMGANVLEGSCWDVDQLCTPCWARAERAAGREPRADVYRAIFTPLTPVNTRQTTSK